MNGYYTDQVHLIFENTIDSLLAGKERTFNEVEMAYFSRFWETASEKRKIEIRNLFQSGQLEFLLGGWVMNDEATSTLGAYLDQMTHGRFFLLNHFGKSAVPRHGWFVTYLDYSLL